MEYLLSAVRGLEPAIQGAVRNFKEEQKKECQFKMEPACERHLKNAKAPTRTPGESRLPG